MKKKSIFALCLILFLGIGFLAEDLMAQMNEKQKTFERVSITC